MTMPRCLRFLLPHLCCVVAAAQERPAVTKLEPPHLATGLVAAKQKQLTVHFDQDMDPKVFGVCGGGASFPRVTRTRWADARTFVLEVELAPDRVYSLDLACAGSAGFRSQAGIALQPVAWRIATAGEALAADAVSAAVDRLFATIREQYSYLDRVGIDWTALEHRYRDSLQKAADGPALALLVSDMLTTAQDPHISVRWQDCMLSTYQRAAVANFDLAGLRAGLGKLERVGKSSFSSRTDDGIGYLFVPTFAREQRDEFEHTLQALRALLDCKALILDVRTNTGGDEMLARRLAAFFVSGEVVYAKHRTRDAKAPSGFREVENRSLRGNNEPDVFTKPVAVLMGPLNMSSCEAFLLMMKQAPGAVLIGADSYGSSGNPLPHTVLPGLVVMLPSWQALRPDGTLIEGEGIAPHLHVDTTAEQLQRSDPILEAALMRLRGQR